MSRLDHILAAALVLLATLCVAGIVHIVTIFAIPKLASSDAFTHLSGLAKEATLALLPRTEPASTTVPFADPAIARGVCLFDLSRSALRVRGTVEADHFVGFSFRTRSGEVFYSMTDQAAQRGAIDVLLLSQEQLDALEAAPNEEQEPSQELRLVSPVTQGMIFIDSLAAVPGEWAQAVHRIEQITCAAETITED